MTLLSFFKKNLNKKTEILFIFLLFLASFLIRGYKLSDNLFFGFEQGRDAQIIEKIYKLQDFTLTGPSTSIDGVFHGPWYYYMMAIPYWLSSGNPLAVSFFLVVIGSLVPVVMYFFGKDIFNSKFWGIVAGVLTTLSYEYILYSRWLSNVSPSPLFILIAFFMLWRYVKSNKPLFFLLFIISASLASLFQMILLLQFLFVFGLLLITKQIKIPGINSIISSIFVAFILFGPLIIFDFRNQHITFNSLLKFLNKTQASGSNFLETLKVYFIQAKIHFSDSLISIDNVLVQVFLFGPILLSTYFIFKSRHRKTIIFLICWELMSLILIFISPGNPQYYVGIGLAWILILSLSLKTFIESKKFKVLAILIGFLLIAGWMNIAYKLTFNKDVFFRTIQEDLNYSDQRKILNFIHNDSKNKPYKLMAFTIPSLHPEGWEYLHKYFYPNDSSEDAKIIYIIIEKNVYPVWEQRWINDLGETELVFEKNFGLLRLQKRREY